MKVKSKQLKKDIKPKATIIQTLKETKVFQENTNPPQGWETIYSRIREYRKQNKAPVDDMGCERSSSKNKISDSEYRFQVLVSLMLSSMTRDPITAAAVDNLVKYENKKLTPKKIENMSLEEIKSCINKVGFYNIKALNLKKTCKILIDQYSSDIPTTLKELISLPGIGPKMCALDKNEGIGVDTHVHRITNRLGWTNTKNPEQTRLSLEGWLPKENWREINFLLVGFGQIMCKSKPKCRECPVNDLCISSSTKNNK